jgi:hypothetical protein
VYWKDIALQSQACKTKEHTFLWGRLKARVDVSLTIQVLDRIKINLKKVNLSEVVSLV